MTAGHYILLVDDDEDIRQVVALVLEAEGYRVICAADGVDALARLEADGLPSLILLDLMMPRMDGEEFMKALRANPMLREIPVVIMSGHSAAREKAKSLSAHGSLVKPVELDQLLRTIRQFAPAGQAVAPPG